MAQKLIIIRGNSGSGKSTIAKALQHKLGAGTMLIPQDVIRRDILRAEDKVNNPSGDLIELLCDYGYKIGYDVIIEGILSKYKYGDMLQDLINKFDGNVYLYYLDISFEETLRRHSLKPNAHEFGEREMREWWKEKDYMGNANEILLSEQMSKDDMVSKIIKDVS